MDPNHGAELLRPDPDGQYGDAIGWTEASEGIDAQYNPRGWAVLRIVLWTVKEGVRKWLYDQPIIVENTGVYIVCKRGDRYGLVRQFRMVCDRLDPNANSKYIEQLNKLRLWRKLVQRLGRWCWEVPAGLVGASEGTDVSEAVLEAAQKIALREAGYTIKSSRIVGRINAHPVFCPHAQFIVLVEVESEGEATPAATDLSGSQQFFTAESICELVREGVLDDARTIASLALCGVSFT